MYHTFLYNSLPFLRDYAVKMPNFDFHEDVNKQQRIFFFLTLALVPWNSTSGGFAYI